MGVRSRRRHWGEWRSEIKEEQSAKAAAGDIRGVIHPGVAGHPGGFGHPSSISSQDSSPIQFIGSCLRCRKVEITRINRPPADHAFNAFAFDFAQRFNVGDV